MGQAHSHCCNAHVKPADFSRAFMAGILLNVAFIGLQVFWGLKANSVALLADAGHNASDVLALALAWGAVELSKRRPSRRFSYGLRGTSVIASLANAVLLLIVVGGIGWESLTRLADPQPVEGPAIVVVALIGVLINGMTAFLFMKGRTRDLNIKAAYLHMLADAGISLGVAVSGVIILYTDWLWLDPLAGFLISVIIIVGTWSLLKESFTLAVQAVPADIDPAQVEAALQVLPGVAEVHDLHIWPIGTTEAACSVHLVMPDGHPGDAFLRETAQQLERGFRICHAAIQIEISATGADCPLAPDHVI